MPEQNIFNQQTQPAAAVAAPANPQSADPIADLLGSIKNERGEPKYKDVQTALEALRHSQEYIPQLKTQKEETDAKLAALAAEVERLKNIEQSVQQLTQQNSQAQNTPAAGITADDVANLVNQTLSAKEKQAIASANINTVVTQVQQAFGSEADKVFYTKAEELGMSKEQINALAAQSPTAVLKLFGLDNKQVLHKNNDGAPPSSSVNSGALNPAVNTFISRNKSTMMVGATTADLRAESENSKKLVEELHSKGLTTYDLTDPKTYFKHFGN